MYWTGALGGAVMLCCGMTLLKSYHKPAKWKQTRMINIEEGYLFGEMLFGAGRDRIRPQQGRGHAGFLG